jgi:hypothetical protein
VTREDVNIAGKENARKGEEERKKRTSKPEFRCRWRYLVILETQNRGYRTPGPTCDVMAATPLA